MWGLRKQVSLLLDHGHTEARFYPLSMVWDEVAIVVERLNREEASRATLIQLAGASIMSKKGSALFKKVIKELNNG